ncbi:M48 family metallopeptidase [Hoeflea sp. CAU 1731]
MTLPANPKERDIAVAGRRLPLTIREHSRATRLTLRIEPGGRALRMTVPPGVSDREVERFLLRNNGWLSSRLGKLPRPGSLADGGSIQIRGVEHTIRRTGALRGLTEVRETGEGRILFVGGAPEHLARRVVDYLRREARAELEAAVARHASALGRKPRAIRLKDTRSRWGSCSSEGNLSFSWRIIMAPDHVLDYLAAHEVAHLREMNHGPGFWHLCRTLCPRTEEAKTWLKRHGSALHAVDFG